MPRSKDQAHKQPTEHHAEHTLVLPIPRDISCHARAACSLAPFMALVARRGRPS